MTIRQCGAITIALVLSACGQGVGTNTAATPAVNASPQPTAPAPGAVPTATLTASPTTVASGGAAMLTWSSTNATACTAAGGWTGSLAPSGSRSTGALTAGATYSLTCSGPGGTSAAVSAAVAVSATAAAPPPSVTLTASPNPVAPGAAATLTWGSTNATSCTASGSWTGVLAASGSKSTGPVATNSAFSLVCTGAGGSTQPATAVVNVVPTATLTANPSAVASGGTSTLTWSSANATACTASGGWTGALAVAGNQVTAAITATKTFSLTCAGAGGVSAVATASVTIASGTLNLSPKTASLTVSQTQQFAVTVPGGAPATWTVDGVANGNAAVGTVSSTGLYTAGTAAGVHTVVATDSADTAQASSAVVAVTDLAGIYTYHNNTSRNGSNTQEYALTTSNVNTTSFGKLAACTVDGAIYAQPLWSAHLSVNGAVHNVVFVATQHDSVYALDADASACTLLWHASLLDAAHGVATAEIPVPNNLVGLGAGDIQPEIGVTGTPVIDPATGILYVVAKSIDAATQTKFHTRLHALDIATGNEKAGAPALITGTYPGAGDGGTTVAFVDRQELQRAGLALVNGSVYIAFTAHEDKAPWYGWMMSYAFVNGALTQTYVLNAAPNKQRAGIWMSGGAPAVDAANNLYLLTGNGDFNVGNPPTASSNDYGDSLLQVTPTLQVSSYFVPSNEASDFQNDNDFGAGGATLLADLPAGNVVTHALIAGGKDGNLYVLNRDLLGGSGDLLGGTGAVSLQSFGLGSRLFATGAVWNNSFYIGGVGGPLKAYALTVANGKPQFNPSSQSAHTFGFAGATPSVSASSTQNGIVWALDTGQYCTKQAPGCGPVVLWAHDAANAANQLWNSATVAADAAGFAVKFTVPTVANGHVYVGTRGNSNPTVSANATVPGELDIYGLKSN